MNCPECGSEMKGWAPEYEDQYAEAICNNCGHVEVLD